MQFKKHCMRCKQVFETKHNLTSWTLKKFCSDCVKQNHADGTKTAFEKLQKRDPEWVQKRQRIWYQKNKVRINKRLRKKRQARAANQSYEKVCMTCEVVFETAHNTASYGRRKYCDVCIHKRRIKQSAKYRLVNRVVINQRDREAYKRRKDYAI